MDLHFNTVILKQPQMPNSLWFTWQETNALHQSDWYTDPHPCHQSCNSHWLLRHWGASPRSEEIDRKGDVHNWLQLGLVSSPGKASPCHRVQRGTGCIHVFPGPVKVFFNYSFLSATLSTVAMTLIYVEEQNSFHTNILAWTVNAPNHFV